MVFKMLAKGFAASIAGAAMIMILSVFMTPQQPSQAQSDCYYERQGNRWVKVCPRAMQSAYPAYTTAAYYSAPAVMVPAPAYQIPQATAEVSQPVQSPSTPVAQSEAPPSPKAEVKADKPPELQDSSTLEKLEDIDKKPSQPVVPQKSGGSTGSYAAAPGYGSTGSKAASPSYGSTGSQYGSYGYSQSTPSYYYSSPAPAVTYYSAPAYSAPSYGSTGSQAVSAQIQMLPATATAAACSCDSNAMVYSFAGDSSYGAAGPYVLFGESDFAADDYSAPGPALGSRSRGFRNFFAAIRGTFSRMRGCR